MKIRYKIILGFMIAGLSIALCSYIVLLRTEKGPKDIAGFQTAALYLIQSMESVIASATEESFAYVISGEKSEKEGFYKHLRRFDGYIAKFKTTDTLDPDDKEEKELLAAVSVDRSSFLNKAEAMFREYETKGFVTHKVFKEYEDVVDKLSSDLHRFVQLEKEDVEQMQKEAVDAINSAHNAHILIAIISVVLSVGIGGLIARTISAPLARLKRSTEEIAQGKLDTRVNIKQKNELGDLAASFNQMAADLNETTVSKEYVDNIVNSMMNSLIIVSSEGKIQYANPITCSLLGYEENEIVGQHIGIIFAEEEELSFKGSGLADLIKEGSARNLEKSYLSKNGKEIPVLFSMSVIRNKEEKIQGIVCVAQDITDRKRAEEAREKLITDLEDALSQIKQLKGLLPICTYCKKVRDDKNYWQSVESYISEHTEAVFSHGVCPDCHKKYIEPELRELEEKKGRTLKKP